MRDGKVDGLQEVLVVSLPVVTSNVGEFLRIPVAAPRICVQDRVAFRREHLELMQIAVPEGGLRTAVDVEDGRNLALLRRPKDPTLDRRTVTRPKREPFRLPDVAISVEVFVERRERSDSALPILPCIEFRRVPVLHPRENDGSLGRLKGLDASVASDEEFCLAILHSEDVQVHGTAFRHHEVDSVANPLRFGIHPAHPDVAVQTVAEVAVERVEALRLPAGSLDGPQVHVRGEAAREIIAQEHEAPVVGRPCHGGDFHVVLRQLRRFSRGCIDEKQVLDVGPEVLRLSDIRNATAVVGPCRLRHIDLALGNLPDRVGLEIQDEHMFPEIVYEPLIVEPEVDPADRPDILFVLADVRQEQDTPTVGRPCVAFDALLAPKEESGFTAIQRDQIERVALVILPDVPF